MDRPYEAIKGTVRPAFVFEARLWFCLRDVCEVLELCTQKVVQRLEDDVLSKYPIVDSLGRTQQATFVNEDGLYDTILESRKPHAKKCRKWVTSEVLPSIRKHGDTWWQKPTRVTRKLWPVPCRLRTPPCSAEGLSDVRGHFQACYKLKKGP